MFGKKLKLLRERNGLTQEQLATKFNLLKSSISMYENGIRLPNVEIIKDFANYFNVSIDYLMDNENSNKKDEELKEQEILKKVLQKAGYMENDEDLTDEELKKLMKFVNANKEFLKGKQFLLVIRFNY